MTPVRRRVAMALVIFLALVGTICATFGAWLLALPSLGFAAYGAYRLLSERPVRV